MTHETLRLGYVPRIDAAPLMVAHEIGFAVEEGRSFDLVQLQFWAQSRDLSGSGDIDAAHMLLPLPVAQALGLGSALPPFDLLMILSQGGQAVAVSIALAATMRTAGHDFGFADPVAAGAALRTASGGGTLRVGVPFPFSTRADLIWHWLGAAGFSPGLSVHTVPPPMMADALAPGEVDAFCVVDLWSSFAVETGVGALLLPGRAIWAARPEKGLVVRRAFAGDRADSSGRLMRAIWRADRWLDRPGDRGTAAEILSRPEYLNLPSELSERGLTGRLLVSPDGGFRVVRDFIGLTKGASSFPWKSLAALFAARVAARHGLDQNKAMVAAMDVFRTYLCRHHLRPAGADLPGASDRVEGAMHHPHAVASEKGQMILRPDAFFDGRVFEPPFAAR